MIWSVWHVHHNYIRRSDDLLRHDLLRHDPLRHDPGQSGTLVIIISSSCFVIITPPPTPGLYGRLAQPNNYQNFTNLHNYKIDTCDRTMITITASERSEQHDR